MSEIEQAFKDDIMRWIKEKNYPESKLPVWVNNQLFYESMFNYIYPTILNWLSNKDKHGNGWNYRVVLELGNLRNFYNPIQSEMKPSSNTYGDEGAIYEIPNRFIYYVDNLF